MKLAFRPPRSVSIGGIKFKIQVRELDESWGEMHFDPREIHLDPKTCLKFSRLKTTLRHEMLHAALQIAGLSDLERYEEESIVRAMEYIFFPAWARTEKTLDKHKPKSDSNESKSNTP